MNKIISINDAAQISKRLKNENKKIILVGGCFDILHDGHIKFLDESKKNADALILLLESDENIKKIKGNNRPINSQKNRSIVLSSLEYIYGIILLEGVTKSEDYDKLIVQIKPDFIAITKGDKNISQREKQCKKVNAKLIQIEKFQSLSSTDYINKIV